LERNNRKNASPLLKQSIMGVLNAQQKIN